MFGRRHFKKKDVLDSSYALFSGIFYQSMGNNEEVLCGPYVFQSILIEFQTFFEYV